MNTELKTFLEYKLREFEEQLFIMSEQLAPYEYEHLRGIIEYIENLLYPTYPLVKGKK